MNLMFRESGEWLQAKYESGGNLESESIRDVAKDLKKINLPNQLFNVFHS